MAITETTSDLNLLAELCEEVQTLHHKLYSDIFKPYSKADVLAGLQYVFGKSNAVAFLAMLEGKAVGYVVMVKSDVAETPYAYARTILSIDQILVLLGYRGKGIGNILMDRAEAYAQQQGIQRIELSHWAENENAAAFFIGHGYSYASQRMFKLV